MNICGSISLFIKLCSTSFAFGPFCNFSILFELRTLEWEYFTLYPYTLYLSFGQNNAANPKGGISGNRPVCMPEVTSLQAPDHRQSKDKQTAAGESAHKLTTALTTSRPTFELLQVRSKLRYGVGIVFARA